MIKSERSLELNQLNGRIQEIATATERAQTDPSYQQRRASWALGRGMLADLYDQIPSQYQQDLDHELDFQDVNKALRRWNNAINQNNTTRW